VWIVRLYIGPIVNSNPRNTAPSYLNDPTVCPVIASMHAVLYTDVFVMSLMYDNQD